MTLQNLFPWLLVIISAAIARWSVSYSERILNRELQILEPPNVSNEDERFKIYKKTRTEVEAWFNHLNTYIGYVLLFGCVSASQASHPAPYMFATIFLALGASVHIFTNFPLYIRYYRQKKEFTSLEMSFQNHLIKEFVIPNLFKQPVYWIGFLISTVLIILDFSDIWHK